MTATKYKIKLPCKNNRILQSNLLKPQKIPMQEAIY